MIKAGVLLAGGSSSRFGAVNKLLAPVQGRPLVSHAASAMLGAGFDHLIAVVTDEDVADQLKEFQIAWANRNRRSQSRSLQAGIAAAIELNADLALIALGDMPNVTPEHIAAVKARSTRDLPSATTDGTRIMVPACFPRSTFSKLMQLEGDTGARELIQNLPADALVTVDPLQLRDVDTIEEL